MSARPSNESIARALRYLDTEFVLKDGDRVDVEMLAEAFALCLDSPGAGWGIEPGEIERAKNFAPEFGDNEWWHVRARADFHRGCYFGLAPRWKREGECVCSRELLRAAGCRCCYRSV